MFMMLMRVVLTLELWCAFVFIRACRPHQSREVHWGLSCNLFCMYAGCKRGLLPLFSLTSTSAGGTRPPQRPLVGRGATGLAYAAVSFHMS